MTTTNNAVNLPLTIPVERGGTGVTSFTPYAVVCGGTTSTGPFQSVSGVGAASNVLTSAGVSSLPVWTPRPKSIVKVTTVINTGSSAVLDFGSTFITSTYTSYIIIFSQFKVLTTNAFLILQYSTNNGTTMLTSGYQSGMNRSAYNSSTYTNSNSAGSPPLGPTMTTTSVMNGIIYITRPSSGFTAHNGEFTVDSIQGYFMGRNTTTTPINLFRLSFSNGTLFTGTATLYGVLT